MLAEVRKWFEPWYNKFGAITLSAAIGFGAYQWINWSRLSASDWGTWAGAIGTVATLIGTIILATSETRQRNTEAHNLAILAASSMVLRTVRLEGAMQKCVAALESIATEGTSTRRRAYSYCIATLESCDRWTIEELVRLVPLPNQAAAKLAFVLDMVGTIEFAMQQTLQHPNFDTPDERGNLLTQFQSTRKFLASANKVCTHFSSRIAEPDDDYRLT